MALNLRQSLGGNGLAVALVASLAANAFLAGLLVHGWMSPAQRGGLVRVESSYVIDRLPADRQAQVRDELREIMPELRPQWSRLRELRQEIADLAAAPQPDMAAIDARLAEVRAITASVQERVQRRLFESLVKLPPDTRRRLAAEAP